MELRKQWKKTAQVWGAAGMGIALLLAGCGGGGGSDTGSASAAATGTAASTGSTDNASASTASDNTAAASSAASSTAGTASEGTSASTATSDTTKTAVASMALCTNVMSAEALVARINTIRATPRTCGATAYAATTALAWSDKLAQAANTQATDMATNNFFSHTGSNGSTVADRVIAAGYGYTAVGENIAAGQESVDAVLNAWLGSEGHCANIMNPVYTEFALACSINPKSLAPYWSQVLGSTR